MDDEMDGDSDIVGNSSIYYDSIDQQPTVRETFVITPLAIVFAVLMSICIAATIVGNVLVVLSVFTYRPLRAVQNFYIVSLAAADLAVAILVMPFNVAVSTVGGRWSFGWAWCHIWLTCDILTCTASILNLCAIAVDRYFAVHDPIGYGRQRTVTRVLVAVVLVWIVSAVISIPPLPLFGRTGTGNETDAPTTSSRLYDDNTKDCQLSDEIAYVIYSASGSFYIPLIVMAFVYVNIYAATKARLRARAAADSRLAAAIVTTSAAPLQAEIARRSMAAIAVETTPAATPDVAKKRRQAGRERQVDAPADKNDRGDQNKQKADDTSCRDKPANESPAVAKPEIVASVFVVSEDASVENGGCTCCFRPRRRFRSILRRFHDDVEDVNGDADYADDDDDEAEVTDSPNVPTTGSRRSGGTSPAQPSGVKNGSGRSGGGQRIWQFLEEKQRVTLARERRAARTMAIVMGAFVVCWLPFFVVYVVFAFRKDWKLATDQRVYNFIVWLGYLNSTLNPLIYTVFNVDFRRAFALLLRGRCLRRHRQSRFRRPKDRK